MKKKTKLTPYLYVIPGLLMVLGFVYIPIIVNLVYSFFRLSSYSSSMKFVGLDNFRRLFTNDTFPIMIRNNVYYCVDLPDRAGWIWNIPGFPVREQTCQ